MAPSRDEEFLAHPPYVGTSKGGKTTMTGNVFSDRRHQPTSGDVESLLGTRREWLQELIASGEKPLVVQWKYYGAKIGWTLKLFERSRNLCFITVGKGRFWVAFVFGDRAVEAIQASALPAAVISEIRDARRYAEGRGIRLEISSRRVLGHAMTLLDIKRASISDRTKRTRLARD